MTLAPNRPQNRRVATAAGFNAPGSAGTFLPSNLSVPWDVAFSPGFGVESPVPLAVYARQSPERALLAAVLTEAIEDAIRQPRRLKDRIAAEEKMLAAIEAAAWIGSDDESHPFAFVSICSVLGLNPDYVRAGAISMLGRQTRRRNLKNAGSYHEIKPPRDRPYRDRRAEMKAYRQRKARIVAIGAGSSNRVA